MNVNVLGTDYSITVKQYDEDEAFARDGICGYCDGMIKKIVLCDMATYPGWEHEPVETIIVAKRQTLRHEIVHAFLDESGLQANTANYDGGWSNFEEMVDWFAIQGPKIYRAWGEAGAL